MKYCLKKKGGWGRSKKRRKRLSFSGMALQNKTLVFEEQARAKPSRQADGKLVAQNHSATWKLSQGSLLFSEGRRGACLALSARRWLQPPGQGGTTSL